jgi:high-affinity K+ transport system ATPase subunit B
MLKPKRSHMQAAIQKKVEQATDSGGKYVTEEQLADILGLSVKDAVKLALHQRFSRIRVKGSIYYSKRQLQAYLSGECRIK